MLGALVSIHAQCCRAERWKRRPSIGNSVYNGVGSLSKSCWTSRIPELMTNKTSIILILSTNDAVQSLVTASDDSILQNPRATLLA